ncbi:hypothetical protein [Magnetovibrio sp.]|uniref:hypothetical protein n=1 Tax=Magnetovibrio sp. TaxID=2024836 RepID=UPI002F92955D
MAPEGAISQPRRLASSGQKATSDTGAQSAVRQGSSPDVSNYVTSPKGVVDPESGVYVLQYRDGATGEVLNQYPSEKAVSAYKRGASNGEAAPSQTTTTAEVQGAPGTTTQAVGSSAAGVAVSTVSTGSVGATSTAGQGPVPTTSTSVDV